MRLPSRALSAIAVLSAVGPATFATQPGKRPDAYTLIETNSLAMPNQVVKIYRDGQRVYSEESTPRSGPMLRATHTAMLLDVISHQSRSWDLGDASIPCTGGTLTGGPGDWGGDPFGWLAGLFGDDLAPLHPRDLGGEVVAGRKAKVMEVSVPGSGKAKIWVDGEYGLLLKMTSPDEKGQSETMMEVKQFTVGKPPASVFTAPARCSGVK